MDETPDIDRIDESPLPTREGYDLWAAVYDGDDNPLVLMEEPQVVRLLGEVAGRSIADIGCGTGRHALRWAADGADVTAVDFSDGMLSRARAKPGADRVRFVRHDLSKRLPFEDAAFDRVTCCLVLDHIHDLPHLFGEMARICRPDGFVLISAMHPAMMLKGVQARFIDPVTGQRKPVESARNEISDYVMAAVGASFVIDHMSEHAVDEAAAARSPRGRKYLGWPILLMMRLRPGSAASAAPANR